MVQFAHQYNNPFLDLVLQLAVTQYKINWISVQSVEKLIC